MKWLVLLDSGFGGPDLFDLLEEVGYYVVRSHTRTLIHANEHCWTLIRDLPVRVGQIVDFGWVHRTAANPRAVRLIAARLYEGEKPKRRNRRSSTKHYKYTIPGLCVVSTNLPTTEFTAITVIRLYARRFEIEHNFRDVKNATLGLDIEHVHLQDAATYSRLMCIVAVAEAASWLFGAEAEARGLQRRFSPCQPRKQRRILSLRHLGRLACHLIQVSVDTLIRRHLGKAIRAALHAVGLTWRDVPDERIVAARALSPAELRPLRKLCRTKEKDGGERCEPGHGWRLLKTQSEPKRAVERLAA